MCKQLKILRNCSDCVLFCYALHAYEKSHCFLSFVITDDYETANAFFGRSLFTGNNDRKEIGNRMIVEFEHLCGKLY